MNFTSKSVSHTRQERACPPTRVGAAAVDLTPPRSMFLYGYPHVPRMSTGVLDPLFASALYLSDGAGDVLFVACDLIWVPREVVRRARRRLADDVGIDPQHVLVTATHTHSGPMTNAMLSNAADSVVPSPDAAYLQQVEDAIVAAGTQAKQAARPAVVKFAVADGSKLGTNRHNPAGPNLPQIPLLLCEDTGSGKPIAVMAVCTMHPTVLHEDSRLYSGDFPGQTRQYLQQHVVGSDCPFVYHMGPAGNQSPRHVTRANTPEETRRLGEILAQSVADAMQRATPIESPSITVHQTTVELSVRQLPSIEDATQALQQAEQRFASLRDGGAPRTEVRTAECDVFGASETHTLALAAAQGKLASVAAAYMPAELSAVHIGPHTFVCWPGEVFVEFGLRVRERFPGAWIITLCGSDLEGYLVTREAVDAAYYEAGNAIFESPASGDTLVDATLRLLGDRA